MRHPREVVYPVATVTFYDPANGVATKVAVAIIARPGAGAGTLRRWFSESARDDAEVLRAVHRFIQEHKVRTILATRNNFGCEHEEGEDYPSGVDCPHCPYWQGLQGSVAAGRDGHDRRRPDLALLPSDAFATGKMPAAALP